MGFKDMIKKPKPIETKMEDIPVLPLPMKPSEFEVLNGKTEKKEELNSLDIFKEVYSQVDNIKNRINTNEEEEQKLLSDKKHLKEEILKINQKLSDLLKRLGEVK